MQSRVKNLFVDLFSCGACSVLARKVFGHGIPIFMLHRMRRESDTTRPDSAITDTHLRRCLAYLAENHFTFMSIRELTQALANREELPERCVAFTMDDGFDDQARIAGPIFQEFNCPATIFLITGMLDQQLWPWDDQVAYLINETRANSLDISIGDTQLYLSLNTEHDRRNARRNVQDAIKAVPFAHLASILDKLQTAVQLEIPKSPPPQYKPLSWDGVREYEKQGIEFAPHTVSHAILSRLDADSMKREILGSWQRLKEELANPAPVFCYPTGRYCDFGSREIKVVREAGFTGAVSTIAAQVRPEFVNNYYLYGLPRYALPNSFTTFKMYCSWLEYIRESNLHYWPR